jgi:hypothetical protein
MDRATTEFCVKNEEKKIQQTKKHIFRGQCDVFDKVETKTAGQSISMRERGVKIL